MALAQAQHRVVVTGIGAITSLGLNFEDSWQNILKGYSGARKHEFPDYSNLPCRIAAKIPRVDDPSVAANNDPLNNKDHIYRNESYYTDHNIQYALVSAAEAMRTAGLDSYLQSDSETNTDSKSERSSSIDRYRIG